MKKTVILTFILSLLFSFHLSAQFNSGGQGRIENRTMTSKGLGTVRNYSVYLPKSYKSDLVDIQQNAGGVLFIQHFLLFRGILENRSFYNN